VSTPLFSSAEIFSASTLTASSKATKKADAAEHTEAFNRVGLLVNEPPGQTGLLFS
jgi:hypothetical protein